MFKIKDHYILQGSHIEVNWDIDPNLKRLYLWYPISWLPWKNYTPIKSKGKMSLFVPEKQINIKIKRFHFFGFKTLYSIDRKAHSVEINNIENNIQLIRNATLINHNRLNPKITLLNTNKKTSSIQTKTHNVNTKVKLPLIKNILPIQ